MAMNGFSPEERVERWYAEARKDADRLRSDAADRAELARIAEETGGDTLDWFKSRHSDANAHCVEVAFDGAATLVRDSQDRSGTVLGVGAAEWTALVRSLGSTGRP